MDENSQRRDIYPFSNEEISCTLLWQLASSVQELNPKIPQSLKIDRV